MQLITAENHVYILHSPKQQALESNLNLVQLAGNTKRHVTMATNHGVMVIVCINSTLSVFMLYIHVTI
jgi:hypothetical protein